ncbi:MAG: hypothetical protein DRH76_09085 [Deltaproteobacteria bacterium]|nr:MAG: hypothetical protein DRH76_09085 [Deltaproteobacteria bacterium]
MAMALSINFKYIKSTQYLEQAISLNPNYADAYSWLADRINWQPDWIVTHDPQDALNYSAKAIALDPLSLLANNNYLESLYALGRYQEAEEIAEHMHEINPNHSFAYIRVSDIRIAQGNYAQGIHLWEKGLTFNSNNPFWRIIVSQLLNQIGLNREALNLLDNDSSATLSPWYANDLEGYSRETRNKFPLTEEDYFGMLLRANAETVAGNYDAAVDYYRKSQFCDLCDPFIYSLQQLGEIESANKLLVEREKRFNKLVKAGVKNWIYNPLNYSELAPINIVGMNNNYLSGDIKQAITLLQQAITEGYIVEQKYKIHPMYENLRAHPKWPSLLAESDAHAAKEREIYLTQSQDNLN